MKIYPVILMTESEDFQKLLLKQAKEVGLDKIDFGCKYEIIKQKAKNKNSYIEDTGKLLSSANPFITGHTSLVTLIFSGLDNQNEENYLRLSRIEKCIKYKKFIKIETKNSVYKLYPSKD